MMKVSTPSETGTDRVLADLLEELAKRIQAGEPVDVEAYLAEHADCVDQLKELLPTVEFLAEIGQFGDASDVRPADRSAPARDSGAAAGMLGDFRILREIGRGGMGVVYEAQQVSLNRRVALKLLPFAAVLEPRHLQRFKNEAQAAAAPHEHRAGFLGRLRAGCALLRHAVHRRADPGRGDRPVGRGQESGVRDQGSGVRGQRRK